MDWLYTPKVSEFQDKNPVLDLPYRAVQRTPVFIVNQVNMASRLIDIIDKKVCGDFMVGVIPLHIALGEKFRSE